MKHEPAAPDIRRTIRDATYAPEADLVPRLIAEARLSPAERQAVAGRAADLVRQVRKSSKPSLMEAFLSEYGLSTEEGVGLMCLAEALLRVPDAETIDELIADKIEPSDWGAHLGHSSSSLVNAATWGLMLTGRVLDDSSGPAAALRSLMRRVGEPVVRTAVGQAMKLMGRQFVLGQTIGDAMTRARTLEAKGYTYSYDMLGEAARTDADARRYTAAYSGAIAAIAKAATGDVRASPGISVKLSALHPRYEWSKRDTVMRELLPRARELARAAAKARIGFNIDAEEAERLDLSLDVIEALLADPELVGWDGFGVVVQAYGRRAGPVIDWLHHLASRVDRRMMVRLVKGAYWDTEIKQAQERGLPSFPVFTRKASTDSSYISCARKLLDGRDRIYPQFASHNAHTAAAVLAMAGDRDSFEFQRLHGMGESLHEIIRDAEGSRCRIYAPVGAHRDLLAYLVRRLLENGANSSFVNQLVNEEVPAEAIAADPLAAAEAQDPIANSGIRAPLDLFQPRRNSMGWNVNEPGSVLPFLEAREAFRHTRWEAAPMLAGAAKGGKVGEARNPANLSEVVGRVTESAPEDVASALAAAPGGLAEWSGLAPRDRSAALRKAADLYEENAAELAAIATREAGKTLTDSIAEIREAVDFLRYYADAADAPAGPPRGTLVCISPWNFPLAIFTGQVAGALAAGNAVLAKPAEQTPLIAARATGLLHEAGVPRAALQLLPGDGPTVGGPLTQSPDIAGVVFTGSTEVAKLIDRALAANAPPEAVLVAETGGLNAMMADTTALTEQVVRDVIASAFQSAGQRCSALRLLYVQKEARGRLLEMLEGAADALTLGDPWDPATDVGPLIDAEAQDGISAYLREKRERLVKALPAPEGGRFLGPAVLDVTGIAALEREVFGPVLHLASFDAGRIEQTVDEINARGYGLTFGLHTRIDDRVERVTSRLHVGNTYVNRNQIGAIVGSQPFGGEGLSGTGPKAGGPHYVPRLTRPKEAPSADPAGPQHDARALAAALARLAVPGTPLGPQGLAALREALPAAAVAGLDERTFAPRDLPGPTGESNRLRTASRGRILALGCHADLLLLQIARALAAGNAVLAVVPDARRLLEPLVARRFPVLGLDGQPDPEALTGLPDLALVAADGPTPWLGRLRRALAAREGPIIPLETGVPDPGRFALERHLCIDTTAAGGNASLLAATA